MGMKKPLTEIELMTVKTLNDPRIAFDAEKRWKASANLTPEFFRCHRNRKGRIVGIDYHDEDNHADNLPNNPPTTKERLHQWLLQLLLN